MTGPAGGERHAHPLIPDYSPELFRGTAGYYSRFRPRYPPVLLDAIERTVGGFELDLRNTLAALAPAGLLTETISAYFVAGHIE